MIGIYRVKRGCQVGSVGEKRIRSRGCWNRTNLDQERLEGGHPFLSKKEDRVLKRVIGSKAGEVREVRFVRKAKRQAKRVYHKTSV